MGRDSDHQEVGHEDAQCDSQLQLGHLDPVDLGLLSVAPQLGNGSTLAQTRDLGHHVAGQADLAPASVRRVCLPRVEATVAHAKVFLEACLAQWSAQSWRLDFLLRRGGA